MVRGLLSTSFSQPLGAHVASDGLRGYYIDFRVKAPDPQWPPAGLMPVDRQLHVDVAQWGLGAFEHFLATDEERWLGAARGVGEHLISSQERDGRLAGGWVHERDYPHTFPLRAPWLSAMAQGEGASLLLRLATTLGDERFAEAAGRAMLPMAIGTASGGVLAELGGGPFLEEYPTDPPSYVLNGALFALWGCRDVHLALGHAGAGALFAEGAGALVDQIRRWDAGWWSRYDLFPHPVPNLASSAYHSLHISQLTALDRMLPSTGLEPVIARFSRYGASRRNQARAMAAKVAFRLLVPRNPLLARRLPWARTA